MKNMVKKESGEFERQFESQREEKKVKISFFYKKESRVKMLDYQSLLAAKVATFNDRGKVSEYYFATI
ncbi:MULTISPECIES: hypothetical protein [Parabacteroides]|uniref:Uncharacterized protein n=4 Tax=Parabacteroides TaxID=375288 RepID=A0A6G1ZLK5_9BACT|nr:MULTISPECIES: hypothetical protein [Parabacteroides]EOS12088.1 hypothetical protein C803_05752 [Parabacteroides goldsteinii dnLKV18]KAI4361225.1 hypothetical protein C825_003288 [Parabacteroides sp. ASF519]MBF0765570.1 hypothetical protein [Parabacteroides goldsteinii]MDZ3929764.1 hypothetical protein [Parabacteroides goldsteinii]MRX93749.1 hypothetical protein [Parabacteroides goldsteinii]